MLEILTKSTSTLAQQRSFAADSADGKTCPDYGKPIVAPKVGFGLEFRVERCDHCFGIWLDQGDWEQLTEKQLEMKIHSIFSQFWQSQVRAQNEEQLRLESLEKLLGPDRVRVVADFKAWLNLQDEKDVIKGYL